MKVHLLALALCLAIPLATPPAVWAASLHQAADPDEHPERPSPAMALLLGILLPGAGSYYVYHDSANAFYSQATICLSVLLVFLFMPLASALICAPLLYLSGSTITGIYLMLRVMQMNDRLAEN